MAKRKTSSPKTKRKRAPRKKKPVVETTEANDDWGMTPRAQNLLIRQAARWNTEATNKAITDAEKDKAAKDRQTLKQIAIAATARNMKSENARVSNGAVRNLIAMEKMNQEDEKPAKQVLHAHVAVKPNEDRIAALAERLGLGSDLIEDAEGQGSSDLATDAIDGTSTQV